MWYIRKAHSAPFLMGDSLKIFTNDKGSVVREFTVKEHLMIISSEQNDTLAEFLARELTLSGSVDVDFVYSTIPKKKESDADSKMSPMQREAFADHARETFISSLQTMIRIGHVNVLEYPMSLYEQFVQELNDES